jgi:hypothetical protein
MIKYCTSIKIWIQIKSPCASQPPIHPSFTIQRTKVLQGKKNAPRPVNADQIMEGIGRGDSGGVTRNSGGEKEDWARRFAGSSSSRPRFAGASSCRALRRRLLSRASPEALALARSERRRPREPGTSAAAGRGRAQPLAGDERSRWPGTSATRSQGRAPYLYRSPLFFS